jgi:hypothetical protein
MDVTDNRSGTASSFYIDATPTIIPGGIGGYAGAPGLGLHFVQAGEKASNGTITWFGLGGVGSGLDDAQTGLAYEGLA